MRRPVTLVTGAGGEIGHGLITRLAQGGRPIVTVNAEPADVEPDGSFKKTITVERDGAATLVVKSVDASGNETVRRVRVFVESL